MRVELSWGQRYLDLSEAESMYGISLRHGLRCSTAWSTKA